MALESTTQAFIDSLSGDAFTEHKRPDRALRMTTASTASTPSTQTTWAHVIAIS